MKTGNLRISTLIGASALVALLATTASLLGQTKYIAYDVPAGTAGNRETRGVGNDFYVVSPICIWQLGVFDDQTNGFQAGTALTVQLYARSGNTGTLLESLTFDPASPGTLIDGSRFKPLAQPLTLLPGPYTIAAYGFNTNKLAGNADLPPYQGSPPPWVCNDGQGLIRFEGTGRFGPVGVKQFPPHKYHPDAPANCFAAGTFEFSAGTLPTPPYAADYAQLTAGVQRFPFGWRRHTGSLAVYGRTAFPVLVEPSQDRLVVEAAGTYNEDTSGARSVAFTHPQWGQKEGRRMVLFENAIQWASKKSDPTNIVIGLGPSLDANYFAGRGYRVAQFGAHAGTNGLPTCDVLVVNWDANFDEGTVAAMAEFTAAGGGLVMTVTAWDLIHGGVKQQLDDANSLLQPFGLSYRPTTENPADESLTNILAQPYPAYFSAFPAAELLGQDHQGKIHLTSLEKIIALNTINSVAGARPDLLPKLAAISGGGGATSSTEPAGVSGFVDAVVLPGTSASTNGLGRWVVQGNDLVSLGRRGVVEYDFNLPAADVYQVVVAGTQNFPQSSQSDFDLQLTLDGISLGHQHMVAGYGTNGTVQCLTPYVLAGAHTLRILWDNAASSTSLQLQSIHFQDSPGPDSNGNGIKDWVEQWVASQSGMDLTNASLTSLVSPMCLEGRDPYPSLVGVQVHGVQNAMVSASPAPNNRWYANVALSPEQNAPVTVQVTYQNGALSETRAIQWMPVNILNWTNMVIRTGDSLLLSVQPDGEINTNVTYTFTIGTNRVIKSYVPVPYQFRTTGVFTVTGTYQPRRGLAQTGGITVTVVGHKFPQNPDCWAGSERYWDLTNVMPQVTFEADAHLVFEQTAQLDDGGEQMGLMATDNELRSVLSRVGTNGAVLSSAQVNGFQFWSSEDTYARIVQTYTDGSQLIEMLMIQSPVQSDVTVTIYTIVGGITFDDGTTVKTLTSADFDALGRCPVRFIRPASSQTSICHSFKVFQGTALLGYQP
jgi:hypothetical protein